VHYNIEGGTFYKFWSKTNPPLARHAPTACPPTGLVGGSTNNEQFYLKYTFSLFLIDNVSLILGHNKTKTHYFFLFTFIL